MSNKTCNQLLKPFLELFEQIRAQTKIQTGCAQCISLPLIACLESIFPNFKAIEDSLKREFLKKLNFAISDELKIPSLDSLEQQAIPQVGAIDITGRFDLPGELYLLLKKSLTGRTAIRQGQVFTPIAIARHMVDLLDDGEVHDWLDPAVGCGIFLAAALEKRSVNADRLFGFEIDQIAALLTQQILHCQQLENDQRDQLSQISRTNALESIGAGCPEIPKQFGRIIMNPPYRNGIEGHAGEWKELKSKLRDRFKSARGSFDLFIPFIERGLELLAPNGKMAVIVPDKWLAAPYGKALRELIAENFSIVEIQHFPCSRIFEQADFEPLIIVIQNQKNRSTASIKIIGADLIPRSVFAEEQKEFEDKAARGWGHVLRQNKDRIEADPQWETIGDVHDVCASLSTSEFYKLNVHEESSKQNGATVRMLSSGAIDPFLQFWGQKKSRFRSNNYLKPLIEVDSISQRRLEQSKSCRVLLANLSSRLEAVALPFGGWVGIVSVIQIFCKDPTEAYLISGWINSSIVDRWMSTRYDVLRMNGQLSLNRNMVAAIPLYPDPRKAEEKQIACRLIEISQQLHAGCEESGSDFMQSSTACKLLLENNDLCESFFAAHRLQTVTKSKA
jgi:type I restriction-modification system DNA methylase subunit